MPGVVVGQPAAERRADHRRHDHRNPEQREALATLCRGEGIRENRLRDRDHAAAAEALQDAKKQQRLQIPSEPAEHRAHGEQRQADQEEALAAEPSGEKAAGGESDGVGDEVGRHHPGGFVLAHAQAAGDVGQRDIGDRRVEHLHEGGERDHHGDQPRVRGCGSARARGAGAHSRALSCS